MKVLMIIVGALGGLYAIGGLVMFVHNLMTTDPTSTIGTATLAATVVPMCLGGIVCLACFQRAFRKPKS